MSKTELISPRTAVRQKTCAILRAALPLWDQAVTPERIHDSRGIPLAPKKLPAVLVYSRDERLEDGSGHADPGPRQRVLDMAVEVVALDDVRVDYLCSAIEAVMENNETLGNLVEGTRLKRLNVDRDSDGENTFVAAHMDFEVMYWTRPLQLESIAGDDGIKGALPVYPDAEAAPDGGAPGVILGMTPGTWELDGSRPDVGGIPLDAQVLYSTAPFIGKEYEAHYEPAAPPR